MPAGYACVSEQEELGEQEGDEEEAGLATSTLEGHEPAANGPPDEQVDGSKKQQQQKKRKKPLPLIRINLANCKYEVLRIVQRKLGWREVGDDEDWEVYWTDTSIGIERVMKLSRTQKINHFHGMLELCRKRSMARNLQKIQKMFPDHYDFFPKTFILPGDLQDFVGDVKARGKKQIYILKPDAGCQGKGIRLMQGGKEEVLQKTLKEMDTPNIVAQHYLPKPYLIHGFKFDMRIYALVLSCDPMRVFIYKEGLARICTEKYVKPKASNLAVSYMHLTNYAVNKHNEQFVANQGGAEDAENASKLGLSQLAQYINEQGHDWSKVWGDMQQLIVKSLISVQPILRNNYRSAVPIDNDGFSCFEVLGFDVMLDETLRPWLIECNHSSSFNIDSPLDLQIKEALITDTFDLVRVDAKLIAAAKKMEKKAAAGRLMVYRGVKKPSSASEHGPGAAAAAGGQAGTAAGDGATAGDQVGVAGSTAASAATPGPAPGAKPWGGGPGGGAGAGVEPLFRSKTAEELESVRAEVLRKREKYEERHLGGYERIFPSVDPQLQALYEQLLRGSAEVFSSGFASKTKKTLDLLTEERKRREEAESESVKAEKARQRAHRDRLAMQALERRKLKAPGPEWTSVGAAAAAAAAAGPGQGPGQAGAAGVGLAAGATADEAMGGGCGGDAPPGCGEWGDLAGSLHSQLQLHEGPCGGDEDEVPGEEEEGASARYHPGATPATAATAAATAATPGASAPAPFRAAGPLGAGGPPPEWMGPGAAGHASRRGGASGSQHMPPIPTPGPSPWPGAPASSLAAAAGAPAPPYQPPPHAGAGLAPRLSGGSLGAQDTWYGRPSTPQQSAGAAGPSSAGLPAAPPPGVPLARSPTPTSLARRQQQQPPYPPDQPGQPPGTQYAYRLSPTPQQSRPATPPAAAYGGSLAPAAPDDGSDGGGFVLLGSAFTGTAGGGTHTHWQQQQQPSVSGGGAGLAGSRPGGGLGPSGSFGAGRCTPPAPGSLLSKLQPPSDEGAGACPIAAAAAPAAPQVAAGHGGPTSASAGSAFDPWAGPGPGPGASSGAGPWAGAGTYSWAGAGAAGAAYHPGNCDGRGRPSADEGVCPGVATWQRAGAGPEPRGAAAPAAGAGALTGQQCAAQAPAAGPAAAAVSGPPGSSPAFAYGSAEGDESQALGGGQQGQVWVHNAPGAPPHQPDTEQLLVGPVTGAVQASVGTTGPAGTGSGASPAPAQSLRPGQASAAGQALRPSGSGQRRASFPLTMQRRALRSAPSSLAYTPGGGAPGAAAGGAGASSSTGRAGVDTQLLLYSSFEPLGILNGSASGGAAGDAGGAAGGGPGARHRPWPWGQLPPKSHTSAAAAGTGTGSLSVVPTSVAAGAPHSLLLHRTGIRHVTGTVGGTPGGSGGGAGAAGESLGEMLEGLRGGRVGSPSIASGRGGTADTVGGSFRPDAARPGSRSAGRPRPESTSLLALLPSTTAATGSAAHDLEANRPYNMHRGLGFARQLEALEHSAALSLPPRASMPSPGRRDTQPQQGGASAGTSALGGGAVTGGSGQEVAAAAGRSISDGAASVSPAAGPRLSHAGAASRQATAAAGTAVAAAASATAALPGLAITLTPRGGRPASRVGNMPLLVMGQQVRKATV